MPIPGSSLSDEELFKFINVILPCWLGLICFPSHKITQLLVMLATLALSVLYALLIFPIFQASGPEGLKEFFTLPGVIHLFQNPQLVFAGWVHYCVADLWVGRWIALDARVRRIPRILMAPVLVAAMMLGPVGLGVYLLGRVAYKEVRSKRD